MTTTDYLEKTYQSGLEYSLDKTDTHDTEYTAYCIEHGERFQSKFFAPSTYTKAQLLECGESMASGWGGECTSVRKEKSEQEKFNSVCKRFGFTPSDYNKAVKFKDVVYNLVGFKGTATYLLRKDGEDYQVTRNKK